MPLDCICSYSPFERRRGNALCSNIRHGQRILMPHILHTAYIRDKKYQHSVYTDSYTEIMSTHTPFESACFVQYYYKKHAEILLTWIWRMFMQEELSRKHSTRRSGGDPDEPIAATTKEDASVETPESTGTTCGEWEDNSQKGFRVVCVVIKKRFRHYPKLTSCFEDYNVKSCVSFRLGFQISLFRIRFRLDNQSCSRC